MEGTPQGAPLHRSNPLATASSGLHVPPLRFIRRDKRNRWSWPSRRRPMEVEPSRSFCAYRPFVRIRPAHHAPRQRRSVQGKESRIFWDKRGHTHTPAHSSFTTRGTDLYGPGYRPPLWVGDRGAPRVWDVPRGHRRAPRRRRSRDRPTADRAARGTPRGAARPAASHPRARRTAPEGVGPEEAAGGCLLLRAEDQREQRHPHDDAVEGLEPVAGVTRGDRRRPAARPYAAASAG